MAADENQKLKLLYLEKILREETGQNKGLTINEIIKRLKECGVNVSRKTLYKDFDELRNFGMEVLQEQVGRRVEYSCPVSDFELPELKLLVDSVQSAKFITEKKSRSLIKKLENLAGKEDAKHLHRQVLIVGRVKTGNERIYYSVDMLHEAINSGRQVRFHYFRWNTRKKLEPRNDGSWVRVSPWHMMWDDENYYLVAFDDRSGMIKHYRVDKMMDIEILDQKREGKEQFAQFDAARYSKSLFGMFGGEISRVTLEGKNELVGVVIDRFGKDIMIIPKDDDHFTAVVEVAASPHFFGWVFSIGEGLRIVAPESVVRQVRAEVERLRKQYFPESEEN